jgi:hypothetical protein
MVTMSMSQEDRIAGVLRETLQKSGLHPGEAIAVLLLGASLPSLPPPSCPTRAMTSEGGAVERLICSSENRMPGHNTLMRLRAGARAGCGGPPSGRVSEAPRRRAFPRQTPRRVQAPFGGARHLPADIEREGDRSRHAIECHVGASTSKSSIVRVARFRPRRGHRGRRALAPSGQRCRHVAPARGRQSQTH